MNLQRKLLIFYVQIYDLFSLLLSLIHRIDEEAKPDSVFA
jgi:hypothetical protein